MLSPLPLPTFWSTYWERQHLHVARHQSDYYQSILTIADLESIISHSDARYPAIRLAKGGGYFSPEIYTRNIKHGDETFAGVQDVQRISEEYRLGATVALPSIHRTWPPLGRLCENLTSQLDHAAHANVYVTPGNARGFTPHYDVHEVFVLQIAGKKLWQLYEPIISLPHRTQFFSPQQYAGQAPFAELELNAGDLLYLPRGVLHSTRTSGGFSAHVTIGVTVYTWVDLVKEFLQSAIDDPQLRQSLPPGFASQANMKPFLQEKMLSALAKLSTTANTGQLIDSFTNRVRAAQIRLPKPFQADQTVIELQSLLQPPPPDQYRITKDGDKTMLEFNNLHYHVPGPFAKTLLAIGQRHSFRPTDLLDPLSPDAILGLSRHLVDIGFLTLLTPG